MTHTRRLQLLTAALAASTLVLALLIVLLAMNDSTRTASSLQPSSVDTIEIHRPGFTDMVLHASGSVWSMKEPCQMSVNLQRLTPLLSVLQFQPHQYQATDVDLQSAGLLEPQASIYVDNVRYDLGNTDLQGQRRYLMTGDKVALVPEWILSLINGGVTAFADLQPFGAALSRLDIEDRPILQGTQLEPWQALSAHQIIETGSLEPTADASTSTRAQAMIDGQTRAVEWYRTHEYVALSFTDNDCAYLFPPEALPL